METSKPEQQLRNNAEPINTEKMDPTVPLVPTTRRLKTDRPNIDRPNADDQSDSHGISGHLSNVKALMHLIKSNIGTGMLAMPVAFKTSGLWAGFFMLGIIGLLATHCMNQLVAASHAFQAEIGTYELEYCDILELSFARQSRRSRIFARFLRYLCIGSIFFTQLGFCCVYVLFMATNVKQVVDETSSFRMTIVEYEALLLVLLLGFVFIRNLKHLNIPSILANILVLVSMLITFQYIVRELPSVSERAAFAGLSQMPLAFGTAVFAFEAINLVLPIVNKMREPDAFPGPNGVLVLGMTVVINLYIAVGFYGYLKFGDNAKVITLSLPTDNWLYLSVKLMYSVVLYFTYGLQFFVPVALVLPWCQRLTARCLYNDPEATLSRRVKFTVETALRILLMGVTFSLAAIIPYLGKRTQPESLRSLFISLVGALTGSALCLIFPPMIETARLYPDGLGPYRWRLVKNVFIGLIGLTGFAFGSVISILEIADCFDQSSHTKCSA